MRHRLLAIAAGAFILGGCAVAPEDDPVQIRMNDLDTRMQRVERVMTNQSLVEMAQRIDALQAELRTMRGEVELLQNQSEGGKAQTRTLYSDLEKRLAALETLGGVPGASSAAGSGRRAGELRCRIQRTEGRRLSARHQRLQGLRCQLSGQQPGE